MVGLILLLFEEFSRGKELQKDENIPVIFCCASTIAGSAASNTAVFMIMVLMILSVSGSAQDVLFSNEEEKAVIDNDKNEDLR